jgi:hypothetical protein
MQEAAKREREAARRKQVAEIRRQALLELPPASDADRSDLDNIAFNIHGAYDWGGHETECTTAVVRTRSGTHRVFPQRFMRVMEEYAGRHYTGKTFKFMPAAPVAHLHAEMYAVFYYLSLGLNPADYIHEIGVSQRICPDCAAVLDAYGIVYNEGWTRENSASHWIDPWYILSDTCKEDKNIWNWRNGKPDDDSGGGDQHGNFDAMPVEVR